MRLLTCILNRLRTAETESSWPLAEAEPEPASPNGHPARSDLPDLLQDFLAGAEIVDLSSYRAARCCGERTWTS
jgi:hypothetical protein